MTDSGSVAPSEPSSKQAYSQAGPTLRVCQLVDGAMNALPREPAGRSAGPSHHSPRSVAGSRDLASRYNTLGAVPKTRTEQA